MKQVLFTVRLTLDAPFHYGGGKGVDGTSSYLAVDNNGNPYWPGSAFKGKVRHYAMQLTDNCQFNAARQFDANRTETCACPVCSMFGQGGNAAGSLVFGDLRPVSDATLSFRNGNAVNRARRVVEDHFLFQTETATLSDVLEGSLTGFVTDDHELELLKAAVQSVTYIGGGSARGLGWLKAPIELIDPADSPIEPNLFNATPLDADTALAYTLTLMSPAIIGGYSARSNHRSTQRHVPGSVIRAALAKEIVQKSGCDTDGKMNFVTLKGGNGLFPTLRATFSNLFISACMPRGSRYAPITAISCKYEHHDILYDSLIPLLCGASQPTRCPMCGERMERYKGLCDVSGNGTPPPDVMTSGKSAIARQRGVAQDEMLYTVELLTPGTVFEGHLSGKFSESEFRQAVASGLRVGGKVTTGSGVAVISEMRNVPQPSMDEMKNRIDCFNQALPEQRNDVLIPVTLLSDAMVSLGAQNEDCLSAYQPLFPEGFRLLLARAEHGLWRGFNTSKREGFLNPIKQVLRAGAVFVLSADKLEDSLIQSLNAMERNGIGERTADGFGQVIVADDFHVRFMHTEHGRKGAEPIMTNPNADKRAVYVTKLIAAMERFVTDNRQCQAFSGGGAGKRQFTTLVEAAQKASCLEELCLFIQYKKAKAGTRDGWAFLADPLATILRVEVKNIADDEGVDALDAARQFLGYLMWRACVVIAAMH